MASLAPISSTALAVTRVAAPACIVPTPRNAIDGKPPLLEQLRLRARPRGDPRSAADNLVAWARAFILFHDKRHPSGLGLPQVTQFLEHVVKVSADPLPALAQARAALTLLYGGVLGLNLGELPLPRPPRLLDQLRLVMRVRHYSRRTEDCYVNWARRFILFDRVFSPRGMNDGFHG